jgi:hypothetical protein
MPSIPFNTKPNCPTIPTQRVQDQAYASQVTHQEHTKYQLSQSSSLLHPPEAPLAAAEAAAAAAPSPENHNPPCQRTFSLFQPMG